MARAVRRGDICWYAFQPPDKKRPVLTLTRDSAIPILNSLAIAPITSTVRGIPTELLLTRADGLPDTCAANFDNLQTVANRRIGSRITHLSSRQMSDTAKALAFALGLEAL